MRGTLKRKWFISLLFVAALTIGLTVTVLSSGTWTNVGTWADFKKAIESPAITNIRLTSNIQIPRNGVVINPSKSSLTIDGGGFTMSGFSSNNKSDTLRYAKAGNLKNITVTNATIVSYNYWGFLNIDSSSNMKNVTATFRDVNYSGPQLVYAVDSSVVLGSGNYTIRAGYCGKSDELADATHIRLEGDVTIYKDTRGVDEVFRVERAGGGVTVASGAVVNVSLNQNACKAYKSGFVHFSKSGGYLRFEDDSFFNFAGNGFFQQCKDVREVRIGQRTQVHIRTHGNFKGCYGIFMINGNMVVEEDSVVNLIATGNTKKYPVIRLDKKTSTVRINNPEQFFVYNSATKGCKGLAIGVEGCSDVANVFYNDVAEVSYWRDNTRPYDNLASPTFSFFHEDGSSFSLFSSNTYAKVTKVGNVGYKGSTPFNSNTAFLRDVNVIFIKGGPGIVEPPEPETFIVEFNTNGGTPPVDPQTVIDGERAVRPDPEPYLKDMVIEGWYEDPFLGGVAWNFDNPVTANMTLHAKWIAASLFSVQYRAGTGGEGLHNVTGIIEGRDHVILSVHETGIFRNNHTFSHWNTSIDGSGIDYFEGSTVLMTRNLILYAQWIRDGRGADEDDDDQGEDEQWGQGDQQDYDDWQGQDDQQGFDDWQGQDDQQESNDQQGFYDQQGFDDQQYSNDP